MSIPVWHTPAGFLGTLTERKTISNYVTIEKSVAAVTITSPGIGYSQGISLQVDAPQSTSDNNITAQLAVGADIDTGAISQVLINNGGSGYAVPPAVTIIKPNTVTINAAVQNDPYTILITATSGIYPGMVVTGTLFNSQIPGPTTGSFITVYGLSTVTSFLQGVGTYSSSVGLSSPVTVNTSTNNILTYFSDNGSGGIVTVSALSNTASYSIVTGSLPVGLYLNSSTGQILGTPDSVALNKNSTFAIRASNASGVTDRSFGYITTGPTDPVWATPAGDLPVGLNGEYFTINKEWVDYSLRADSDLSTNRLSYYIADRDGQLPPGLRLTTDGRIYGYINDNLGVDISASPLGGYDSDPYDTSVYESVVYDPTTSNAYSYINKYSIVAISKENPIRVQLATAHNLTDGDKVLFGDVQGMVALNGNSYLVQVVDQFIFNLYALNPDINNKALLTTVDGTLPLYYPYTTGGFVYWGTFNPNQPKSIKKIYQFYITATDGVASARRKFSIQVFDHDSLRVDTSYISADSGLLDSSASYLLAPIWQSKNGNKLPLVGNLGSVRAGKELILDTYNYDPYPLQGPTFYDWNTALVNPDIKLFTDGNINLAHLQTTNLQGQNSVYYKNAELIPVVGMKICFGDYIPNTDNTVYTVTGVIPLSNTSGILNIDQPLAQQIPDSRTFYVGTRSSHPVGIKLDPNTGKLYGRLVNQPVYSQSYRFTIKIIKIDQTTGKKNLLDAINTSSARIINKVYTTLTNEPPEGVGGLTPAASYTGSIGDIWLVGETQPVSSQFLLPLMDGTLRAYVFTGPTNPSWVYIGEVISSSQIYLLNVIGNVASSISFVSTSSLGTITPGEISELYVKAVNTETNYTVEYEIIQGQLPPGLMFNSDGTIQGRVINSGQTYFDFSNNSYLTFDNGTTTIDKNYYITVRASDAYRLSAIEQKFYITVYQDTAVEFTRIYLKPFLSKEKRGSYKDFVTDPVIFDPLLLYRPADPEFGIQQQIKMIIETGIQKASLDEYASAMNSYFYRKRFYFGNIKTIKANDGAGNYVYDLIYAEIVDDQMDGAIAPSESVSVVNMQYRLETIKLSNQTEITLNSRLQPRYMTTLQADTGIAIGFIKAVPICYTIPGGSVKILSRITNAISTGQFNFSDYNFDTDRILIETTTDANQEGWVLYPTARQ
jgi:Ubiquitin-activating enzyme E1 FCCH domain/Putative Ig domain